VLPCHAGEGLSNAILEAMAAGLPVVATTVGGNPELVADGRTGLLVPPRDPGALANAMSLLLADPRKAQAFGAAGKQRVMTEFLLERMVRETESFYLRAVNRDIGQPDQASEMYPEAVGEDRRPYRKVDLPPVR
jgi:glycosyltransferase involved in cell wall biosynthesis